MTAALLVAAAAVAATATRHVALPPWSPPHRREGLITPTHAANLLPILTLSHHIPTPLSPPNDHRAVQGPQDTSTLPDPLTSSPGRQVLPKARAGHPPTIPTTFRIKPPQISADLLHCASPTVLRASLDHHTLAGAAELAARPWRFPTRSSMHSHPNGRPRAAQARRDHASEPPQLPTAVSG